MILWVVRGLFVLLWSGMAAYMASVQELDVASATIMWSCIVVVGGAIISVDVAYKRKKIPVIFAIIFGTWVGSIIAQYLVFALVPFLQYLLPTNVPSESTALFADVTNGLVTSVTIYLCISFILQTKDDFRFVIPYVEFSREMKGNRPLLIDTSVLIDGRIADLIDNPIFDNPFIVPGFVLQELQMVADSSDKLKRNRGRRGLDVLNRLRNSDSIDFQTDDTELPEFERVRNADQRLVLLAKHMNAKIITNDFNLNKIARAQGIPILNLNDIANALKPAVLPGESMTVRLTKEGDQPGQGVGYLDDGTMVVVEQAKPQIGNFVQISVTSVLQTSAGRIIFGKLDEAKGVKADAG